MGYHRIADTTSHVYGVCVSPEHFIEQMQTLRKYALPISLSKLVQHLKDGSLPPKSVAVTFDDGYADNLYSAKPILENYEIPATVFICTGYVGKQFWWDELDRLIMASHSDVNALRMRGGEKSFEWEHLDVSPEAGLDVRRKLRQAQQIASASVRAPFIAAVRLAMPQTPRRRRRGCARRAARRRAR